MLSAELVQRVVKVKWHNHIYFKYSYINTSMLGKNFSRQQFEIFLFFSENRLWHFMQIASLENNLHEMLNSIFWEKFHQFVFCWISP